MDVEYTANNIYCRGSDSCIGNLTTNDGTGTIYCHGDGSCEGGDNILWKDVETVYCSGSFTCDSLSMYGISNVYGLGRSALSDATIDSTGGSQETLNIYLSGEGAGDGMTVNCNGNDECTVYCLDTNLNCLDNIEYTLNCGTSADCSSKYYFNYNTSMDTSTETGDESDSDNATKLSCLSSLVIIGASLISWS